MRSLYSQSEVHLLCGNGLIKFMVNNQPFNDDEMWNVEEIVSLIRCLLLDTRKSVCVAARCSESVGWLALAECVSGPLRELHADLRAQSEGSYLRQSEWDGPQEAGHYQAFSDPNYGGRCGMKVEGRRGSQNQTPWVPLQLLLRGTHRHVPTHTHTQQQAYTTLSPWRAHAHTESQHDSTLSFSLVIAIVLPPAPPRPKRYTSIFSVP